jgi:hypothetical protein
VVALVAALARHRQHGRTFKVAEEAMMQLTRQAAVVCLSLNLS